MHIEGCIKALEDAKKFSKLTNAKKTEELNSISKQASKAWAEGDPTGMNKLLKEMTRLEHLPLQLTGHQLVLSTLKTATLGTLQNIATSIALEKVTNTILDAAMHTLEGKIKEMVKKSVSAKITGNLGGYSNRDISTQFERLSKTERKEYI